MSTRYQFILAVVTIAACILLISPGNSWWVESSSAALGGTDTTDARGHIGLFCILTMAWMWGLAQCWTKKRAITVVVMCGIVLAAVTELAQLFIPERGSSLIDFGADVTGTLLGVSLMLIAFYWMTRKHQPSPAPPEQLS